MHEAQYRATWRDCTRTRQRNTLARYAARGELDFLKIGCSKTSTKTMLAKSPVSDNRYYVHIYKPISSTLSLSYTYRSLYQSAVFGRCKKSKCNDRKDLYSLLHYPASTPAVKGYPRADVARIASISDKDLPIGKPLTVYVHFQCRIELKTKSKRNQETATARHPIRHPRHPRREEASCFFFAHEKHIFSYPGLSFLNRLKNGATLRRPNQQSGQTSMPHSVHRRFGQDIIENCVLHCGQV